MICRSYTSYVSRLTPFCRLFLPCNWANVFVNPKHFAVNFRKITFNNLNMNELHHCNFPAENPSDK